MGVATKAMAPPACLSRTEQAAFPRALFLHVEIFTHEFLKSCREAPSTACSVPEANCWCAHCGGGWRGGLLCLHVTAASSFPSEHQASIHGSCRPSALLWIPQQMQPFLLQYWGPTVYRALAEGTPLQGDRLARGPRRRGSHAHREATRSWEGRLSTHADFHPSGIGTSPL